MPLSASEVASDCLKMTDATLRVSVGDFPCYDGSSSPEDFLRQCCRLAKLGGVPDDRLCCIIASKCRGAALEAVNALEDSKGELSLAELKTELNTQFGGSQSVEQAAQALATLVKGTLSAREYGLKIKRLVRLACPDFLGDDGRVKKICVPAYGAALYRHFLVGLSPTEKRLLSRLKAGTFDSCVEELTREENLQPASEVALTSQRVRWSSLETPVRGTGRSSGSPIPGRRRGSSSSDSPSPRSRRWSPPRREECWRCRGRSTSPLERRREQSERRRSSGERPPGRGDPGGRLRSPSPGPAGEPRPAASGPGRTPGASGGLHRSAGVRRRRHRDQVLSDAGRVGVLAISSASAQTDSRAGADGKLVAVTSYQGSDWWLRYR